MAITLDGTTGITTPGLTNTGTETLVNLTTTGNTTLGDASTDTLNVGNGGLVKDASGNVGIGVTPNANWSTSFKALDIGFTGNSLVGFSASDVGILSGCYYQGGGSAGWKWSTTNSLGASYYEQYNGASIWNISAPTAHTAGNPITFTQAMTLDASGNLILGGTSPTTSSGYTSLSINNATNSGYLVLQSNGTNKSDWYVSGGTAAILRGVAVPLVLTATGANYLSFETNGSERARINSSGSLLVQTTDASISSGIGTKLRTDPTAPYIVTTGSSTSNADGTLFLYSTGASQYRFYVGYGGTIYATNTTISAISDIRYKENVRDLDVGLDKIMALKPRLYDWKEGKGADIKNARGFIAQEFEEVFPDLIDEWRDPAPEGEEPYKSVRQDLIPVLVKAIQEQQALITTLTDRITALENK